MSLNLLFVFTGQSHITEVLAMPHFLEGVVDIALEVIPFQAKPSMSYFSNLVSTIRLENVARYIMR